MGYHEDEVRARQERELDILRGLGSMPSTADMRAMNEELAYAALMDHPPYYGPDEDEILDHAYCMADVEPTRALAVVRYINYIQNYEKELS